jgi:hypothetical protein
VSFFAVVVVFGLGAGALRRCVVAGGHARHVHPHPRKNKEEEKRRRWESEKERQ